MRGPKKWTEWTVSRPQLIVVILLAASMAGCGSASYADRLQASVSTMQGAFETYNQAHSSDLKETGTACRQAATTIETKLTFPSGTTPRQYRMESRYLTKAGRLARAGFADCAGAAAGLDYPRMVRAGDELAAANAWVKKAARAAPQPSSR